MLSRGARKFLFLGRSGLTRQVAKDFVHELESQGAEVRVVQGDVSRLEDVENAVSACSAPLGGVVQAAMGLDVSFPGLRKFSVAYKIRRSRSSPQYLKSNGTQLWRLRWPVPGIFTTRFAGKTVNSIFSS